MERQYQQLQPEERLTIASMHLQGSSMRAMARMLGRSPAAVSRELARNCRFDSYASMPAQALTVARRIACRPPAKLDPQGVTWRIVLTLLDWKWSPQQISGTLRRMYPNDLTQQVSHETIYAPKEVPLGDHGYLRPAVRGTASPARCLSAPPSHRSHAAKQGHRPARTDSRHGQHPRAPARSR